MLSKNSESNIKRRIFDLKGTLNGGGALSWGRALRFDGAGVGR